MPRRAHTARHRRLVQELRRLREQAGLRQEDVARELDWSLSKQEKIERGAISVRIADVRAMLDLFGLSGPKHREQYDALVRLARDARVKGWWNDYADAIPGWFESYVGFEADASGLLIFQDQVIPGLLQTEDYARAIYEAVRPALAANQIDRAVAARMERQSRLTGDQALKIHAVLDEAVLHRRFGGSAVLHEQLLHLERMARHPQADIEIQVRPFTAGAHPSVGTSFVILRFQGPEDTNPDVVYLEDLTSSAYLEEDPHLFRYNLAFKGLSATALPEDESIDLIGRVAARLLEQEGGRDGES
ncbi:Helix-turn-helix domain-containing protein [Thermomonospora echinospora]|uniref:Helix-turn-helix domain-containing protein n=1 Tax=Thermomonospora echinospora TaxID=1992 RepID=A0A1H6DQG7_9ACTN|nr:helix-turn-helix transcriptional regulator [Thermomonospora echinospora]SEG87460.1 Helix-turn-helix domain-containing protein [Thermomonospora echinospora]